MERPTDPDRLVKVLAKVGTAVAAFCVFTAGWMAMRSDDWRMIAGLTALAALAGLIAARLSGRAR